ncbi:hypothetical protein JOB18_009460 [Solea senegalensis]|uniref:Uncharacterized protein n=1 Tax=Solea senegalensis TaxID=28829 RepID=A0AAV6RTU0_SOLSE|nr:hypothetical protein JOB18_009460 [Solea senegalensis]
MDSSILALLDSHPCDELFSCLRVWWQNARCQETRHDFISKMFGLLVPLLFLLYLLFLLLLLLRLFPTLCGNLIFTSTQDPVRERKREKERARFWAGGRTEEANKAGCPFVLAGCGAVDHPSLSETSISGSPRFSSSSHSRGSASQACQC